MINKKEIVWFEEVDKGDVGLVGGKGANLGEMTQAHFPIPYGFIVTSQAYFRFIKKAGIQPKIAEILRLVNFTNPDELQQASSHIKQLILKSDIPLDLSQEIVAHYDELTTYEMAYQMRNVSTSTKTKLKIKHIYDQPLVAVRSSATAEDLPTASFAGQQETYLNIRGENHLVQKVRQCWASLFTERAIFYRHEQHFDHFKVGLAVVVQRMVQSAKSGIAFSIDPVTNDKSKIVIEAIFGLGEYIVGGVVTPDHYEIDKRSFIILNKKSAYQNVMLKKSGISDIKVQLNRQKGSRQKLTEEEIVTIALAVKDIENHYYFPQDIEWAMEKDKLYIVQSRPITTIKDENLRTKDEKKLNNRLLTNHPILVGSPASPGIGVGPVKIIKSPSEIDKVKVGDILTAPQTNPDYVPAMKKAKAIITEKGGRTSHAAIVSRELGIPAVVGADRATHILKENEIVSVNGATGEIFKGSILSKSKLDHQKTMIEEEQKIKTPKTLTKVYVNLAEPEKAYEVSRLDVDGIGLLRAEFMIAQIGIHPKEFIKQKKQDLFRRHLSSNLLSIVKAFSPRPVVYRATDFKTNEYRHLKGGAQFEPKEENPMLGFRGAFRYLANPDVFGLELLAIRSIWEQGYHNLHLMIPFVRVPWELIKIRQMVESFGLFKLPGFKLWIMVEVPSCALNLEEFIKIGIDGVSIGTNDLTMMLLGVDRDNEELSPLYDERNPVVIKVLEQIVKTCSDAGVTCSICGQAASDYPDLVEQLVRLGITSVSINPDVVIRTRQAIYDIEKKIYGKN